MASLSGRRALVTGAGMGIGQGIALELARQAAHVAVHYAHSERGAQETVEQIQQQGGRAVAVGGDLSDVGACFRVVDEAASVLGGLDILVNNGGVTRAEDFSRPAKRYTTKCSTSTCGATSSAPNGPSGTCRSGEAPS